MKWGQRKEREASYRKKLSAITKRHRGVTGSPSDIKRFKYRSQPVAVRIAKTAGSLAAQTLIADVLTGRINSYQHMSKKQIAKKVGGIAATTFANVALQDSLAKSASKRYTEEGKRVRGTKSRIMTKEDAIEMGIDVGVKAAYVGKLIAGQKLSQAVRNRQENEARFNAWGQNILSQNVDNVIWSDFTSGVSVIDRRRG